jgi:hypothetical protein
MKQHRIYLLILFSTIIGFVLVEIYKPKPIDWTPTYSNKDKIPYGTEVLYKFLPEIFRHQKISDYKVPFYRKNTKVQLPLKSNYIYVYQYFRIDSINLNQLLSYVHRGNNAFIAAEWFYGIDDTLHFEVDYAQNIVTKDTVSINFVNPTLVQKKSFRYHQQAVNSHFTFHSKKGKQTYHTNAIILGKNDDGLPNFIRIPFGKGLFFLSTVPKAFSNYYLLKDKNAEYAFKALSYLPENPIFWDEYVTPLSFGKVVKSILKSKDAKGGEEDYDTSPFKYIVSQPALKWAYFITLASLFLYLIFEGKRRQRIIPIIEKPKNTSLEFVETIGALYFNHNDHKAITEKKIAYLLAYIRNKFFLKTTVLDQVFKEELSLKSGVNISTINEMFEYAEILKQSNEVHEKQLILFNKYIEDFYKNT